jgi:hypothetical protein
MRLNSIKNTLIAITPKTELRWKPILAHFPAQEKASLCSIEESESFAKTYTKSLVRNDLSSR